MPNHNGKRFPLLETTNYSLWKKNILDLLNQKQIKYALKINKPRNDFRIKLEDFLIEMILGEL